MGEWPLAKGSINQTSLGSIGQGTIAEGGRGGIILAEGCSQSSTREWGWSEFNQLVGRRQAWGEIEEIE